MRRFNEIVVHFRPKPYALAAPVLMEVIASHLGKFPVCASLGSKAESLRRQTWWKRQAVPN